MGKINNELYNKISDYLADLQKNTDLGNRDQVDDMWELFEIFLIKNNVSWDAWQHETSNRILRRTDAKMKLIMAGRA